MPAPEDSSAVRASNEPFRLGDWTVHPTLDRLERGGEDRRLEPKIMAVLLALAVRPGEVHAKESLLNAVWADTFVADGVLLRSISELRRALGDNAKDPRYIETIPKKGYRLIARVEPIAPTAAPVFATPTVPTAPNRTATPTPLTPARRPPSRRVWWALATVALALVVVRQLRPTKARPTITEAREQSAGASETLTRAWAFLDRDDSAANASAIEFFKRALEEHPDLPLAYAGLASAYARGVERFGLEPLWLQAAVAAGRQAVERAPEQAASHLGLGRALHASGQPRQAREAVASAVAIKSDLHAGWHELGRIHLDLGALDEAARCLHRARDGMPHQASLHASLAETYRLLNEPAHARTAAERARSFEPYEPLAWTVQARLAIADDRLVEARDLLLAFRRIRPDHAPSLEWAGVVEFLAGNSDAADSFFRDAQDASTNLTLAHLYNVGTDSPGASSNEAIAEWDAIAYRARQEMDRGIQDWRLPLLLAGVAAVRGDTTVAMAALDQARQDGFRDLQLLATSPAFMALAGHEPYQRWRRDLARQIDETRRRLGNL